MALHAACPKVSFRWLQRASCAAVAGALFAAVLCAAQADTFGSGSNEFTIDFVAIGSVNNLADTVQNANDPGDTNRYGAVSYEYRISTYEISQSAVAKATNAGLANVTAQQWGPDRPVANITWYEAAAFVNWLNTSKGYSPAYNLVFTNGAWSMQLWDSTNAWTAGGTNLYRHRDSFYFLPSINEWYKAAYYNPAGLNYFLYPTAGNSAPASVAGGTSLGSAVYLRDTSQSPAAVTNAGGLSPFGTMGQGGNVWEWLETASDGTNNSATENRQSRGGLYFSVASQLASTSPAFDQSPTSESFGTGFRVASAAVIITPSADLTALSLSTGTLNPEFERTTTLYAASVPGSVSSVTVTPTAADPAASIEVSNSLIGYNVNSGTPSGPFNLQFGLNIIYVIVVSSDGASNNLYTLRITREDTPYSPAVNDRFSSGFPANPIANTNSDFAGRGYDWSGVGWSVAKPFYGFALLTPQHFLTATHAVSDGSLADTTVIAFAGDEGLASYATGNNPFAFPTSAGMEFDGEPDVSVGLLAASVPSSTAPTRYAVADFAGYVGLQVFTYGRNNFDGNSSPQIAATTVSSVVVGSPNSGGSYFTTPRYNGANLMDGSSGGPAFHGWTNPNGAPELVLFGINSAYDGVAVTNFNLVSFLGAPGAIDELNSITTLLGYAVRVAGNPQSMWIGSTGTDGDNLFQSANWLSNTIPDTYSLFDAASAAQRTIVVNTAGGFRGIYFRSNPGENNFTFTGFNVLGIGRGGIVNYDDSRQHFTATLRAFENQVWESGPGGLGVQDLEISGFDNLGRPSPCLVEFTGIGSSIVNGTISGVGSLAVSSGDLVLNGSNSYTGYTWVNGGRLILGGSGTLPPQTTVDLAASGAVFDMSGLDVGVASIGSLRGVAGSSVNLGTKNLSVAPNNISTTFAGVISNTGGLIKLGSGTFTLTGANTYSGMTTVSNGVLEIGKPALAAAISPTATAVNFALAPASGAYDVLPGPLGRASLGAISVNGLSAGSSAIVVNNPNLKVMVYTAPGDFSGLNLSGQNLRNMDASGANFTAANLQDADLSGAIFTGANLQGANLAGATLDGIVSSGITGTPVALPQGWILVSGTLIDSRPQNFGVLTSGGSVQSVGDRLNVGFLGSPGVVATADDGQRVARQGSVGMAYFATGFEISPDSPSINEAGSLPESSTRTSLSARMLYDDGTFSAPNGPVVWSAAINEAISVSPEGVAQANAVYQNTIANFTATITGGGSLTNFLTVVNTLPDNFGAWAGDTFDDAWEIAQGMTGALNPTNLNNGVPAWQLYAMGINPAVPFTGSPAPTRLGTNSGFLTITYTRNPYATGYDFRPQEAGNLAIGFSNMVLPVSTTNLVNSVEQITTRGSVPMSSTNRQFLRLQITRPQP